MALVKKALSRFRSMYLSRFVFRCICLVAAAMVLIFWPEQYNVIYGWNFFKGFSVFHLLWAVWITDMALQLIPCRNYLPLGSQKFLSECFKPLKDFSIKNLMEYIKKCKRDTVKVALVWASLVLAIGALYFLGVLDSKILLLISVVFYVCDLICVLFWCPFRAWFMKNRCCTTCRIFNWDHFMMFSPLIFVPGFYTWSLCFVSFIVLLVWEVSFALHPERFWEGSNEALKCSSCTDRLCGKRNCIADIPSLKNNI